MRSRNLVDLFPPRFLDVQVCIGCFEDMLDRDSGLYAATPQLTASRYSRCSRSFHLSSHRPSRATVTSAELGRCPA